MNIEKSRININTTEAKIAIARVMLIFLQEQYRNGGNWTNFPIDETYALAIISVIKDEAQKKNRFRNWNKKATC
ncbi:MAG: hypothetical protein IKM97_01455 [Clostridia bacterium]|nr:hypothetical protein [Clostridia bacterium]